MWFGWMATFSATLVPTLLGDGWPLLVLEINTLKVGTLKFRILLLNTKSGPMSSNSLSLSVDSWGGQRITNNQPGNTTPVVVIGQFRECSLHVV